METQRLFDICKKLNASIYRSGSFGKEYLDETIFEKGKTNQMKKEFVPNLAIIDLLFHEGEKSREIIIDSTN